MGGAMDDNITIGIENKPDSAAKNIVLGDGGKYVEKATENVIKTIDNDIGGVDTIKIYGGDNVVMGGFDGDKIYIGASESVKSDNNIVLGDGGVAHVNKDGSPNKVKTIENDIGGEDTIEIYGGNNVVMGGAMDDEITIGIENKPDSAANNIVLGDGGKFVNNETQKVVKTIDDSIGGVDTIHVYGGSNVAMGGAEGDKIYIGTSESVKSDNNVVLGDGGKYNLKKDVSLEIRTTSNEVGGTDTIEIHGGKNTVMGGFKNDDIDIFGNDNVVLGDGGIANYDKHPEVVKDNTSVNAGLTKVETTADKIVVEYADPDKPNDEGKRLNDDIDIHGDINIVMGGVDADKIIIDGADNVVVGDAGVYTVRENCLTVETKNEPFGGHDIITTGDGKNTILGGTDVDEITTGNGNDIIVGDGGLVIMDNEHNPLIVTNSGKNVAEENEETKSAGGDFIITAGGDNVIFGGLGEDKITSGNGEDVVFGDNGYATFRGNAGLANDLHEQFTDLKDVFTFENAPEVRDSATLSFNFQGPAQWGIGANEQAGVLTESENHRVGNWNNIKTQSGQEAGTYGNDDKELVYFDDGTRASAVSVTYGASESHRVKTSDGANIRLHGYDQSQFVTGSNPGDVNLMKSGLEISGNNARNTLLTQIDGLDQYFTEYDVIVYLDMVRENSMPEHSVRMVTLFIDTFDEDGNWVSKEFDRFYVNDPDNNTFNGSWTVATGKSVETAIVSNCVIFKSYTDANGVVHTLSGDRFHVEITDPLNGTNGKDRAGIAGIQVCGKLHKQDIAASTDIDYGSKDTIKTSGGDDIVVGGTGGDEITTYGDEYYGIDDFDVVFGDNAKILLTDRDSKDSTASTLTHAESIAATNFTANYDDIINTGDGNDVVVGGIGHDVINTGATEKAQTTIEGVTVTSFNFVRESTNQSMLINDGESAGVVVDNHWKNVYLRNNEMRDRAKGNEVAPEKGAITFDYTSIAQWNNNNAHEQEDPVMDADTGNNKMMKTLVMGQKYETLSLSLHNLPGSENSPCDVYVYVGGKLEHGDAYDYVFEITGSDNKKFYLNDWAGNSFEGEFKEITCTSYTPDMLVSGVTPSVSMIGNYVVFRGIKTAEYTVQIRCVQTGVGNQQPNDIPVFTGVQIVSGVNRTGDIAVGGDHDKDLVFGDDAMLDFDLDIPFAGNENLSDYKNRVISATSMSVSADAAKNVRTDDEIHTGIDRDVVVGGDGADIIRTGAGDDVILGDNASLKLENNNPIGVFRPDVEIVLEDNQYFQGTNEAYLDNDGVQVQTMEQKYYQGNLAGIALQNTQNGRRDDINGESGKDLVFEGEYNEAPLYVEQQQSSNNTGNNQGNTNQGENNTGNNQGDTNQGENNTGNNQGNTNQGENNQGTSNNTNTDVRVETIGTLPQPIVFEAGETVKLVCSDYPQGDSYWTPNICIRGNNAENAPIPELDWAWDGEFRVHTNSTNDLYVDIPDHPNGENGMYEIYVTAKTSGRASLYVNQ